MIATSSHFIEALFGALLDGTYRCPDPKCRRRHRRITALMADEAARTGAFSCRRCGHTIPVRGCT